MKNIFIAIISLASIMVYNQAVAQNNCDLDVIVPIKGSTTEADDPLPDLTPPDDVPEILSIPERRMVYFIHGLNGSDESWTEAYGAVDRKNNEFNYPGYKVEICVPDYENAQSGLNPAVNSVEAQVRDCKGSNLDENYDFTRGIAIAHSQGGIVARALDMKWSEKNTSGDFTHGDKRRFGGIVTVATPNRGAQILNNKNYLRGLVYDLADNLTAGPYSEFRSSDNFFVRLIAKKINLGELRQSFVEFIGNDFGSFLLAENMPPITNKYTVPDGSEEGLTSKITDLNEYAPLFYDKEQDKDVPTRKVAFYAVGDLIKNYQNIPIDEIVGWEDDPYISIPNWETKIIEEIIVPISWGTIHFQLNSPNDEPTFEADDADYLTAYKAHQTKHFYESQVLLNEMKRQYHSHEQKVAGWTWDPIGYRHHRKRKKRAENRRNSWNQGVVFLSKFDELYRIVIGARYFHSEFTTVYEEVCECTSGFITIELSMDHCDTGNGLPHFNGIDWDCEVVVKQTTIGVSEWRNKASDGVVLVESQRDIEQNTWEPQKLEGVTHMQVRNSSHTAEMMKTVFEGGVGIFFITPRIED